MKLRPCFRLILIAAILFLFAAQLNAQTPEAKTKSTGSISGRVTIGEKPAPGITVVVTGPDSTAPMGQTTSDADGNYRFGGLAAGPVSVTPVAPAYSVPAVTMFGPGRAINLSANETVENIDFKLARSGVITGRITDADGRPVIEERISLVAVDQNGVVVRGPTLRPSNFMMYQTDDRGIYRIYGLPAGHYKLSAGDEGRGGSMRAAGYYPRTYYPDSSELGKAAIIDVSEGGEAKNIDIKLGRRALTYTVSGRIVDAEGGQPLPGIIPSFGAIQQNQNQSFVNSTSGPSSPTNSQGEFRLEGLPAGRYVLMINSANAFVGNSSAQKYYCDPLPFEVLDSDLTNLELKAQRGLSISGVIVPDGITDKTLLARISKLMVHATIENPPADIRTFPRNSVSHVSPDGSFLIEGLPPGKITLDLSGYSGPESEGFSTTRIEYNGPVPNRQIELAAGQSVSGVKIYVAFGTGAIRGQVKVEGGTLPAEAFLLISVNRQGGPVQFSGQVDARGRFLIKGIPPGNYEVVLRLLSLGSLQLPRGFQRQQRQTITVADSAETEVLFNVDLSGKDVP
jgi:protocatechuate 3,4-dioxygenase beta subunit